MNKNTIIKLRPDTKPIRAKMYTKVLTAAIKLKTKQLKQKQ